MKIEEYISSGILESYVLDQLSDAEKIEVEKMANEHAEIQEEMQLIELSVEALAFKSAMRPADHVKSSILDTINSEESASSNGIKAGIGADIFEDKEEIEVRYIGEKEDGFNFLKYAAAASIVVALGSSVLALNYWNKWKSAENRLSDLIAQNEQFAENYNTVNQQLSSLENAVAVLDNSSYTRVVMNGTDNSPDAKATIYWNKSTQDVYLSISNLKELSQNQQYQLWAIIDGKPVDAGVFDPSTTNKLLKMKNTNSNAVAFAVTIEPKGGSENPTLETMQVIGNA